MSASPTVASSLFRHFSPSSSLSSSLSSSSSRPFLSSWAFLSSINGRSSSPLHPAPPWSHGPFGSRFKTTVGFIGLGNMGAPMALNLLKDGFPLTVYDVKKENVKVLTDAGASSASSPAEVAAAVDTVMTVLPASDHVRAVYTGPDGILSGCKAGSTLIDSSTIDPGTSMEMAARAVDKNAVYMDAPISGGVMKAKSGALAFMVGATKEEFEAAKSILEAMGTTIIHCGPVSSGIVAKMCNNMLLAICMIGTSEAMNLGIKLGLEPKVLAQVINSSSGSNWASTIYNPVPGILPSVPSSNFYEGGFLTALMTKDLGLVQDIATACGAPAPLGSLAHQLYRILNNGGMGQKDFSVVYKYLSEIK